MGSAQDSASGVVMPNRVRPGASLIGFWVVEVESEARALEIAGQIVAYAGVVEVRPVQDAPPEP